MLTIRDLTINDLDNLINLLHQLWPGKAIHKKAVKTIIIKGINNNHQFYYCATLDDKIVGFCSLTLKNNLWTEGTLGNIDELVVDENYRNKGIGKELLLHIERLAQKLNCTRMELDSAFHRSEAHVFYEHIGFEKRAYLFSKSLK